MQLQHQSTSLRADRYRAERDLVSERMRSLFASSDIGVYDMCRYHMGWIDESGAPTGEGAGKMIRPLLCLAACSGFGDATRAVGAAAALELLHSFSLVHDDIEDGDRERRHRPTVWARYGMPPAINAGDMLFALAYRALFQGLEDLPASRAALGHTLFTNTALRLMEGQHLDLDFEMRQQVALDQYVRMVRGKTGAVMGAALGLGALCGGASPEQVDRLIEAGVQLGLAFQAVDDALALWGDPAQTGKAAGNDLQRGKKSLPVVLAMDRGLRMSLGSGATLAEIRAELEQAGVRRAVDEFAADHREQALRSIEHSGISAAGLEQLIDLADFAVSRDS